nr:hypothetical protein [Legionella pneumophila]
MTNTTDFYSITPLDKARWQKILINKITVRTLGKIFVFIMAITIMITLFNFSYATDSKLKPTVITVSEEEFQVDGKGKKQRNLNSPLPTRTAQRTTKVTLPIKEICFMF